LIIKQSSELNKKH